ncbi:MAG: carbohydrate deacetylase [Acidobacteriota bacterium]
MKRLIVTGDDLGLTPGVVEGIEEGHRAGILTSASLMVNAPAAAEAFRLARGTPSLSVGLHFVLTFGRPVGPAAPLAELLEADGTFARLDSGAHGHVTEEAVRGELAAQIDLFTRELGRAPAHLDSHHHVHGLPGVLEAVIDSAHRLGIPVRAPNARIQERLSAGGVRSTGHFIGAFYGSGQIGPERLVSILESLPEGTSELMCHPARPDTRLAELSSYARERYQELSTLTAPSIRETVSRLGIRLAPSSTI